MSSEIPTCSICGEDFKSRNKLFIHIKDTHSARTTDDVHKAKKLKSNNSSDEEKLKVAFEDEWIKVIIKPQGV